MTEVLYARYGKKDKLEGWARLCQDLGIQETLTSITQCRKAVNQIWVNIYDLVDYLQHGTPFQKFKSLQALAKYSKKSDRIFPRSKAKAAGPVRGLLKRL